MYFIKKIGQRRIQKIYKEGAERCGESETSLHSKDARLQKKKNRREKKNQNLNVIES